MGRVKSLLSDEYWEGMDAFKAGYSHRDNPYISPEDAESMKTRLACQPEIDWSRGWWAALSEDRSPI